MVEYDEDSGAVLAKRTRQGFADCARRTTDHWLQRTIASRNLVPEWDFDAPGRAPRDSSAAAIAAAGMAELARLEPDPRRGGLYGEMAIGVVEEGLSRPRFLDTRRRSASTLLQGTSDGARGRFDHGLVYGDYYDYLEAILRLERLRR